MSCAHASVSCCAVSWSVCALVVLCALSVCNPVVSSVVSRVSCVCCVCARIWLALSLCAVSPLTQSRSLLVCVSCAMYAHPAYAPAVAFACSEWAEGWSLSERDICSTDTVLPFQPGEGVLGDLIHDTRTVCSRCVRATHISHRQTPQKTPRSRVSRGDASVPGARVQLAPHAERDVRDGGCWSARLQRAGERTC